MNSRKILAAALALGLAAPLLSQTPANKPSLTPEQGRERMMRMTGGILEEPPRGKSLVFLDLRPGRDGTVPATAALVAQALRLPSRAETASGDARAAVARALAAKDAAAAVAVVLDPSAPSLLIAPEDRWAVVNAAPLAGRKDSDVLLRKELWRALGFLMGAGNGGTPQSPFRPVLKPADLEAFEGFQLEPQTLRAVSAYSAAVGIVPGRRTTYRRACEEGWAPMPTNQFQKAIWEQVKAKK